MGADPHADFATLAAHHREGADYRIVVRPRPSPILVLAPHGGDIEPGTSELAEAIAGDDHSLYCFEGVSPKAFERLHITSTRFDEPRALAMAAQAATVLGVHGLAAVGMGVLVGGRDGELAARIAMALAARGFAARRAAAGRYAGLQPKNICNRGTTGRGVQLEIARGLRDELRHHPKTKAKLAVAIRSALEGSS